MDKNQHGITLIELVITLAILGVALSIAFPNLRALMLNNRAVAQVNDITAALNYARSEALKRGQVVVLCPSDASGAQTACDEDSINLARGWLIRVEGTGEVIRQHNALIDGSVMTLSDPIRFAGNGGLARDGGVPPSVTLISNVNGCRGDLGRQITLAPTGSITIERINCS